MEETKPRPGKPGDRAQIAAEKLRALRQRANQALEEHRGRLAQIESELNLRVRQLADEFEATSAKLQEQSTAGRDEEVAALRAQLEEGRVKHERFVEQLAVARRQLDAIQAQPCAACQDAANQLADAQGEIRQLRDKLDDADRQRDEDRQRHEKFSEQVAAARAAIAELQSKSGDQTAQLLSDLEAARLAHAAADEQIAALTRDLELLHTECEAAQVRASELERDHAAAIAELRRAADADLDELRCRIASLEAELTTAESDRALLQRQCETDQLSAESLTQQLAAAEAARDAAADDLAVRQREWEDARAGLEGEIAKLQSALGSLHTELAEAQSAAAEQLQSLADQLAAAEASLPAHEQRIAALEAELADSVEQLAAEQARGQTRHADLSDRIATLESEKEALARDLAKSNAAADAYQQAADEAQQRLGSAGDADQAIVELQQQLTQARTDAAESDRALEELQAALDELDAELNELRDSTCPLAEVESLQHKCDLALADVQRLKQENGRLQEDLATRPAASDGEPPELVAMRVERDDLLARVDELQQALETATLAAADSSASDQDAADLQRRFEMAVDDVRQLKQQNAQLREQLAAAKSGAAASSAALGGSDWASQKARLLAMLEQEEDDGPIPAERKKERAKIAETIAATDRVIAEKERELVELRSRATAADPPAEAAAAKVEELLTAEPLIAAERERLASLQAEWEEKLRAAELEFSVERAKLAREQAALRERMLDIQKLEPQAAANDGDKHPRRRWLSALGLGEDQAEPKKPK